MPASYVHQSVAADALTELEEKLGKVNRSAVLAGSEGPDPLFFSFITKKGHQPAPEVGTLLHKQNTGAFLKELITGAGDDALLQSFVYGFLSHYSTDTICHPYIFTKSYLEDGSFSSDKHCKFEHALDVYLYRKQGYSEGLPQQMAGYAGLTREQSIQLARLFTNAINTVFPEKSMTLEDVFKSFKDSVRNCRMLRTEALKKHSLILKIASRTPYAGMIDSHVMPNVSLSEFVAGSGYSVSGFSWNTLNNSGHGEWRSTWEPERPRTESFEELYAQAVQRSVKFISVAADYYSGAKNLDEVIEVIGNMSYDSGINA